MTSSAWVNPLGCLINVSEWMLLLPWVRFGWREHAWSCQSIVYSSTYRSIGRARMHLCLSSWTLLTVGHYPLLEYSLEDSIRCRAEICLFSNGHQANAHKHVSLRESMHKWSINLEHVRLTPNWQRSSILTTASPRESEALSRSLGTFGVLSFGRSRSMAAAACTL